MIELFKFDDYKQIVTHLLEVNKVKGARSKLSRAISCHLAYISQVLEGHSHFTMEQGQLLCQHFNFTDQEMEFFLNLLGYARAGTPALRKYYEKKVLKYKEEQNNISSKVQASQLLTQDQESQFYQSWINVAVFVLTSIPNYNQIPLIAENLKISERKVLESVGVLEQMGLVIRKGPLITSTGQRLHVASDSSIISKHHSNWRIKAIQSLDSESVKEDLHFSTVYSLSVADVDKIRDIILKCISTTETVIRPSKEEVMHCLCIDWFKV